MRNLGILAAWALAAALAPCAFARPDDPPTPPAPAPSGGAGTPAPTEPPPAPPAEPKPAVPATPEATPPATPTPAPDAAPKADAPPEPKKDDAKAPEAKPDEKAAAESADKKDEKKPDEASTDAAKAAVPEWVPVCADPPPGPCGLHGSAAVRYRFQHDGSGDADNDLYEYLSLTYRNESDKGWSGSFYGRLAEDLDGKQDNQGYYAFDSVDDTYDSPVTGRLYHLFATYRPQGGSVDRVVLGRQYVDAGWGYLLDGVYAESAPLGCKEIQVHAFGGVPAYLFNDGPEGGLLVGAGVFGRPWTGAEGRIDWAYTEDKNDFYSAEPTSNLFTAELRQRVGSSGRGRLWYQQVDENPRLLGASYDAFVDSSDLTLRGSFVSQLQDEKQLVYALDPYYAIAETLKPYWQLHASASKGIGEVWAVEGGVTARQLWQGEDEGTYNHDFVRLYGTVSADRWPARDLYTSVTLEWWGSDSDVFAGGFEVDWRPCGKVWRATTGIDYSLYRTDIYSASERYDSWEWYGRVTYAPTNSRWKFEFAVRLEDDSLDTYATVQAGARYEF